MLEGKQIQFDEVSLWVKNNMGIVGMSLGILSVVCFPLGSILGAAGIICSILTLKKRSAETVNGQREFALCGIICGGIGTLLGFIAIFSFLVLCIIWIHNGGFYI